MKLGVHVGYGGLGMGPQEQLQVVQEAERLGYDSGKPLKLMISPVLERIPIYLTAIG